MIQPQHVHEESLAEASLVVSSSQWRPQAVVRPDERFAVDVLLQEFLAHHQAEVAPGMAPRVVGGPVDDVAQIVEATGIRGLVSVGTLSLSLSRTRSRLPIHIPAGEVWLDSPAGREYDTLSYPTRIPVSEEDEQLLVHRAPVRIHMNRHGSIISP